MQVSNSLSSDWTVNQRLAARMRAIGYTQQQTAEAVGVELRTVQRWEEKPDFVEFVQALHEAAWQRIEPGIMANVALAVDVQREMLLGKVKADDKRYLAAQRLIDRILDRLLYVEPAPAEAGSGKAGTTVNILNAGPAA